MSIAPAQAADREKVIILWRQAGLTRPWNDPQSDFDLALSSAASTILLAREGSDPIGSVMAGFDGHRGWLYYLATDPARLRRGVAHRLVTAAEEWLKDQGCRRIRLMVRNDNEAASHFYEAAGYEMQDVTVWGRTLD